MPLFEGNRRPTRCPRSIAPRPGRAATRHGVGRARRRPFEFFMTPLVGRRLAGARVAFVGAGRAPRSRRRALPQARDRCRDARARNGGSRAWRSCCRASPRAGDRAGRRRGLHAGDLQRRSVQDRRAPGAGGRRNDRRGREGTGTTPPRSSRRSSAAGSSATRATWPGPRNEPSNVLTPRVFADRAAADRAGRRAAGGSPRRESRSSGSAWACSSASRAAASNRRA